MLRESLQQPIVPPRAHRNSDALIPPLPSRGGALGGGGADARAGRLDSGAFGPHPDDASGPAARGLQAIGDSFASLLVANKGGLGAMSGVFVPCMLSIIGLVLFLRLGWSVGEAGVLGALSMIGVGTAMSLLTAFSLCALATNGKIRGGGAYYLISRSLGPEMGGAIGVCFFLANSVGISFYMQGFTDTLAELLYLNVADPSTYWLKLAMAGSCLTVETVIAIVGSGLYSKCAGLLNVIQLSAISFAVTALFFRGGSAPFTWTAPDPQGVNMTFTYDGPSMALLKENLYPNYSEGNDYAVVFKTIFPALTGMFAGANMSGVLKRPEIAIPKGTLTAIVVSSTIYCLVVISLGCSVPRKTLQNEYLILSKVVWYSPFVNFGILSTSAAAALASMQSAARVIQAVSLDNMLPFLSPLRHECNDEPVAAILLSVGIAMGLLFIGDLDLIAPILTMFFLLTYCLTNVACLVHRVSGHPNFRPMFRFFTWHTALVGAIICAGTMFFLDWRYTLIAILLVIGLCALIVQQNKKNAGESWGDVSQSLIFHQVRKYLLRLDTDGAHVKFWRPQFMVVVQGGPCGLVSALEFIDNVKKGGLFVIGDTVTIPAAQGSRPDQVIFEQYRARRVLWKRFLEEAGFKAFSEIMLEPQGAPQLGAANLFMSTGIGGLKPNTLVLTLPEEHKDEETMTASERAFHRKLQVTSNSVYEKGAADGCRITCAYQTELWSKTAGGDGSGAPAVDESDEEGAAALRNTVSTADYVGMLQDAVSARKHLVLLGAMAELQKHEIAQRLGKFSPQSQEAWIRKQSPEKQQQERARRETLNPWVIGAPVVVDVWVMPWCDQADLMLSCQLAYMLSRDDFWTKHSYLRVCGVVGSFSELGADDCDSGVTLEQRRAELYNEVWRSMRIPATIEVFNAQDVVPQVWASSREEFQAAAKWSGSVNSPGRPGRWEMADQSQRALCTVLNAVVREVNANTAVSICSCPDVPVRSEPDQAAAAERFMSDLTQLTAGIGPTMLVKALPGSNVVTTDL
jgi:amino acid transporter